MPVIPFGSLSIPYNSIILLENISRRVISPSAHAIIARPGKRVVPLIPSFVANSGFS